MKIVQLGTLCLLLLLLNNACKHKSPEQLPKYKDAFRAQIASFEKQKVKTDQKVNDGVSTLSGIQEAIENAKNVDKEFNRVYTKWKKVDREVSDLTKEYNRLKEDAENLFGAMERQTESLADVKTKNELRDAIRKTRTDYGQTLANTQMAIDKLQTLHSDAVDVIKALEVAVALGQISEINSGLKNIESKVASIMTELNVTITESKALYDKKMGAM